MITKRMIPIILIALGCLCLPGFSGVVPGQDKAVVTETKGDTGGDHRDNSAAPDYPVVGYLKKRDKTITIKTGPDGPLYTVESKDGKILAVNLPAEKLYAKFPQLRNDLENGFAVDASNRVKPIAIRPEEKK